MSHIIRLLKFGSTGVLNTLLTFGIYTLLVSVHSTPFLSLALGYAGGMLLSYFVNSFWTFEQRRLRAKVATKFFVFNVLLLLMAEGGLHLLLMVLRSPILSQAVNSVVMALCGYAVNRPLVFPKSSAKEDYAS